MLRVACKRLPHLRLSRRWASVSQNGVAATSALTTGEFLTQREGPGVYTTARTCAGGQRLFEWDMHVQRTVASAAAVLKSAVPADDVTTTRSVDEGTIVVAPDKLSLLRQVLGTVDGLRPLLDRNVAVAVDHFRREAAAAAATKGQKPGNCAASTGADASELRIAVTVGFDPASGEPLIAAHVDAMPPPPPRPVRIEVRGAPRQDAAIKSSAWIKQRKPLEELMRAADVGAGGINELVLSSSVPETEAKVGDSFVGLDRVPPNERASVLVERVGCLSFRLFSGTRPLVVLHWPLIVCGCSLACGGWGAGNLRGRTNELFCCCRWSSAHGTAWNCAGWHSETASPRSLRRGRHRSCTETARSRSGQGACRALLGGGYDLVHLSPAAARR